MEEKGFAVTAVLPSACLWSAFICFIAVYIRLWRNQSKERGKEISEYCRHPGRNLAHGDTEQQRPPDLIHHPASPTAACRVLVKHRRDIDGLLYLPLHFLLNFICKIRKLLTSSMAGGNISENAAKGFFPC